MMTPDEALGEFSIMGPGEWENETGPKDWYAVVSPAGIVAYVGDEITACHLRLLLINLRLNPLPTNVLGL